MNESLLAARQAGLRYVDLADPGIRRVRRGAGFIYRDEKGKRLADRRTLDRIGQIAIPPAWQDVWISPHAHGHIQAVGRDARRRLQYRYHPLWTRLRNSTKFERTIKFARALPKLRRRIDRDLRLPGLPRRKVIAAAVRLLDRSLIRVGNEAYAEENGSFGFDHSSHTPRQRAWLGLKLSFRGKGGKQYSVGVRDKRLARVIKSCQELPGQRLFQYVDDEGRPEQINSDDVNEYVRDVMGEEFSAKDFRTWAGTVLAVQSLLGRAPRPSATSAVNAAVKVVAQQLGNTAAVCRASYIHPDVIESYLDGSLASAKADGGPVAGPVSGLRADERLTLAVLMRSRGRGPGPGSGRGRGLGRHGGTRTGRHRVRDVQRTAA